MITQIHNGSLGLQGYGEIIYPVGSLITGGYSGADITNLEGNNSSLAGIRFSISGTSVGYHKTGLLFKRSGAFGVGHLYLCNNITGDDSDIAVADARLVLLDDGTIQIPGIIHFLNGLIIDPGTTSKGHIKNANTAYGRLDLSSNLTFDGANWNLDDTGLAGSVVSITPGSVSIRLATAGANPRTLSGPFTINNTGTSYAQVDNFQSNGEIRLATDGSAVVWGASGSANSLVSNVNTFYNTVNSVLRHLITSTGTHVMSKYGDGTASFTGGDGTLTTSSDERQKNVKRYYVGEAKELKKIKPIVYSWNDKSGIRNVRKQYIGFSAQNVKKALGPLAVGKGKDGYLTLHDRAILACLVNTVNKQSERIEILEKALADKGVSI